MSAIDDALNGLLRGRAPASIEGIAGVFGARPRTQNPAMARALTGLPSSGRLPAKGTLERRQYEAALRNVQRYRAPEGRQRRRPAPRTLQRLRAAASATLTARNVARARREGLKMAIRANFRMYLGQRRMQMNQRMPASGYVFVPPGPMLSQALDIWTGAQAGEVEDADDAGWALFGAFMEEYAAGSGMGNPHEEGEIEVLEAEVRWAGDPGTIWHP